MGLNISSMRSLCYFEGALGWVHRDLTTTTRVVTTAYRDLTTTTRVVTTACALVTAG
ncbi:hypothetical protein [Chlorogloeopsis sp. ULAP02]|uniref:hypothetical protein n=1 Tax=Chlorogloeopsis sp. ULAP02 TaxID=3107926 RepID=UPI003137521A